MAVIRSLDGESLAERAAGELENAIHAGTLKPGHEVSLSDLAARYQVRHPPLHSALAGLVEDGLLEVTGGRALVAPLEPHDLRGLGQLRGVLFSSLCARSSTIIKDSQLDGLELALQARRDHLLRPADTVEQGGVTSFARLMIDFNLQLIRPSASKVEFQTLRSILLAARRYNSLGWSVLHSDSSTAEASSVATRCAHLDRCHELIDSFRMRNTRAIQSVASLRSEDAQHAGQASLIPEYVRSAARRGRLIAVPSLRPVRDEQ